MNNIDITRFAEIRARLDAGLPPEAVLQGVELAEWRRQEEKWLLRLADETEQGAYDNLRAFEDTYRTIMAEVSGVTETAAGSDNATASVAPDPSAAAHPPAEPTLGQETAEVDMQALRAAIPFVPAALLPREPDGSKALEPLEPPSEIASPREVDATGTEEIDMVALRQYVMPFVDDDPSGKASAADVSIDVAATADETEMTLALPAPGRQALVSPPMDAHTAPPRPVDPRGAALPFMGHGGKLMPLASYVAITAALTREGDPDATFARLGTDSVSWMATVRGYSVRFAEDPLLKTQFDALMAKALDDER